MRYLTTLIIALMLTGCANTMDSMAGIGVIEESKSTFDDGRIVTVTPAWAVGDNDKDFISTKIGARWVSTSPESVAILLQHDSSVGMGDSYTNYTNLKVNINDDIQSFKITGVTDHSSSTYNTVSKDIYTSSSAAVTIPMSLLKQMIESDDVRLRIESVNTYEDVRFDIEESGYGQRLAKSYIEEMLKRI